MKTEKLALAVNDIDEELILKAESPAKRRPRYLRYAAAAAALLLIFGAAFGVAKAAGAKEQANLPEKYAFMADTEVPKDAVLPPSQTGKEGSVLLPGHDDLRNLKRIYEESDVVCAVTIRNWLGETELYSYYEADVERVYKGDPGESIVIYQLGKSSALFNDMPLFTYGDKLLLGLCRWEDRPQPNAYYCLGQETAVSYIAAAENREVFVIDVVGEYSYWTELECPEVHLTNYADDLDLMKELYKDIANYDSVFSKFHEGYWQGYYKDRETFLYDTDGFAPHVYSLDEIEAFFGGLN